MAERKRVVLWVLTLFVAFVFIQSLFFKFTGSPETEHIFATLDGWAEAEFGLGGVFADGGIFSAIVIGSLELGASLLLLFGMIFANGKLHGLGALLGLGIMTGAIHFHLFTPLGTVIVNEALGVESDGGLLFGMACSVWISCLAILFMRRQEIIK